MEENSKMTEMELVSEGASPQVRESENPSIPLTSISSPVQGSATDIVQSKNTDQALSVTVSTPHSMHTSADASEEEPVSQSLQSNGGGTSSKQVDVNNDDVLNVHMNAAGIPAQEVSASGGVTQGSSLTTASDGMMHGFPSTATSGADPEGTVLSFSKRKHKKKKRSRSAQQPSNIDTVLTIATASASPIDVEYAANCLQTLAISNSNSAQTESHKQKKKKKKKSKKTVDTGETHNQEIRENGKSAVEPTAEVKSRQESAQSVGREARGKDRMEEQVSLIERGTVQDNEIKKIECALPPEKLDGSRPKSFKTVRETTPSLQSVQLQHTLSQPKRYNNDMKGAGSTSNSNKRQPHKKLHFEEYWSTEKVSEGLKRGTLIEGRIRINPKNFEDAYVPLPDGSADVYISGTVNRNRSLNGDVVAVLLLDRESWRVYQSELQDYEGKNSPMAQETNDVEIKEAMDADDSPDVVIEEEETVDLDKSGQPIESTRVVNKTPEQPASVTPRKAVEKEGSALASTLSPNKSRHNRSYVTVKDVINKGSPVARQLFQSEISSVDVESTLNTSMEKEVVNMNRFVQKTGKVVAIIEKKHSRASSGSLRIFQAKNPNYFLFSPVDSRVPRMMIPANEAPPGFKERPEDFANILYIARIAEWSAHSKFPRGVLARSLGEAGQIEPQTEAILMENDVDSTEFSQEILACLPKESPWTIPETELQWRKDFRSECVFTIDPSTARDLDDALSCKDLENGQYEVGVHIADVSYFVKEDSKLDKVAASRATSVYLVQKVIPMLPRLLCEQLCSLNPNEDRLTFSVVWKMTEKGEILEEWFGRSIIRSCVKLSYDHAQGFIDQPEREWTVDELPPISDGFTIADIKTRVLTMNKMAQSMRRARFDSGALRLDQVKIQFTLDKDTGLPDAYFVYEQRDSNKLVEEFMLLANMAVAHKIKSAFNDKAVLRRHPPPQSRMIDELKETCESLGFPLEVKTAKDIQKSLDLYTGEDELSKHKLQILVAMCSKPMQMARYFCCGMLADEAMYHHYALNVPLYTHFTSPIRRYPDILVHRTLAAALEYCEVTKLSSQELHLIADHCNDKKTNAKRASELSNELYFSVFVKEAGPLEEKGMVMSVLDKSFDVFVLKFGVVKRVYCEKLPLVDFSYHKRGKRTELVLNWKPDDSCPQSVKQSLSIFSTVQCVLKSDGEGLKWSAVIQRPPE